MPRTGTEGSNGTTPARGCVHQQVDRQAADRAVQLRTVQDAPDQPRLGPGRQDVADNGLHLAEERLPGRLLAPECADRGETLGQVAVSQAVRVRPVRAR